MISFIANKVAIYQVDRGLWETNKCSELLVEPVWNGLQCQCTLSQDDTTGVDTDNSVHVTGNIELSKAFHACTLSVFHILLRLLEFLRQLDTRMREDDPLKIDELSFVKFDVDYGSCISDDNYLRILIPLLNGESFLCYLFIACVDTLNQSNDTILFCYLKSPFQCWYRTAVLVDFVDVGIFEITEHFIVNVFC